MLRRISAVSLLLLSAICSLAQTKSRHFELNYSFTVRITDRSGNYYSFLRTDLASVTRDLRSAMPNTYSRLFTPGELDNLLAYLASLRGEEAR